MSVDTPSRLSKRQLSANMEDYLEAIYTLSSKDGGARVSSLAGALGVKLPSVSKAIRRLGRDGLVTHTPYGGAVLTTRGREVAALQVRTHHALTHFLEKVLLLDEELAQHDACLIEHAISAETVERLAAFIDHLEAHGAPLAKAFHQKLKKSAGKTKESNGKAKPKTKRAWTSKV